MFLRARVCLVVAFCLLLPVAALAQHGGSRVPDPKHIVVTALPDIRNWSAIVSGGDPLPRLDFSVDLDLLAPLGTRDANAAIYFARFAKPSGDRTAELDKASTVEVEGIGRIYGPAEPLVAEAQAWMDVSTMRFYPDVFKVDGPFVALPNIAHFAMLGRTWAARANSATDGEAAKEDYRRIIRLGRLARQDSVTPLQELSALGLIKTGASGLYRIGRAEGDAATMTVAALVTNDANMFREAIRSLATELSVFSAETVTADKLDRIVRTARQSGYRPARGKALMSLYFVANTASKPMRETAAATIASLASDADPIIAADAKYFQNLKWTSEIKAMMPKDGEH